MFRFSSHPSGSSIYLGDAKLLLCNELCQKLAARSQVPADKLRALIRPDRVRRVAAGQSFPVSGNDCPPLFLLSGWACEQRLLENGRRQIFSFLTPGDLAAFTGTDFVALTAIIAADASELFQAANENRAVASLLQQFASQRTATLYQHIVRLGTQNSEARAYDLFSELFGKLDKAADRSVDFPLTQEMLADMLGMTAVHVNRVLQNMRRNGSISLHRGRLTIHGRRTDKSAKKTASELTTIKETVPIEDQIHRNLGDWPPSQAGACHA